MHNLAIGNGAHFVERLAIRIAVHTPNINSFMKPGVNDASPSACRITDNAVLAAFHQIRLSKLRDRSAPAFPPPTPKEFSTVT